MIKSMTGFGKESLLKEGQSIAIEIRTLNSKQLDLITRISSSLKEKEGEIRSLICKNLQRGKIELSILIEKSEKPVSEINNDLALSYFRTVSQLAEKLNIKADKEILMAILNMPDVVMAQKEEHSDDFWHALFAAIQAACDKVNAFRTTEGIILAKDIDQRIRYIEAMIEEFTTFETERIEAVKNRLRTVLEQLQGELGYDKNRFEEELIYYIEKMDITEEKVRLRKHCQYFYDTMQEEACGKKLGFILQEIGREINTLGSKAVDHQIQQIVVRMKDELEKVKEQILNIL